MEPDERRGQIFACAVRLFGEQPYAAVSTTDIAKEAGVARGLINHYFGTKRNLYLEVLRSMVTIPPHVASQLPAGPLSVRVQASVDWFLDNVSRNESTWLVAIGAEGLGRDPDVERILAEADEVAADRVLEAVGLADVQRNREQLRAMIRAYAGMVKAAGREWLHRKQLSREQVRVLLTRTLLSLVEEAFPEVENDGPAEG